jgi:two-component system, NtrC family, nitrogen regulation sensor histidine kinase NtrY
VASALLAGARLFAVVLRKFEDYHATFRRCPVNKTCGIVGPLRGYMSPFVALVFGTVTIALGLFAAFTLRRLRKAETRALDLARQRDEERVAAARSDKRLRSVVETAPTALVVFAESGTITFTNAAARELFFDGAQVEGKNFLSMVERAPETLRRGLFSEGDELFTVDVEGSAETFHLAKRYLDGGETLIAVKEVTQEIGRQELATLKRVIRIMDHEIRNSLTPISSLVRSARTILNQPERWHRLEAMFLGIEERTTHLGGFLEGMAKMAGIPEPLRDVVPPGPFVEGFRTLWPDLTIRPLPERPGFFDRGQIQQVLINLIKNAREAGGPISETELSVESPAEGGIRFTVLDRGTGMADDVMQNALLPFFTTKPQGSGVGLPLCREIVELHRGRLRLARRAGGGMAVSFWLPDQSGDLSATFAQSRRRLSLTSL